MYRLITAFLFAVLAAGCIDIVTPSRAPRGEILPFDNLRIESMVPSSQTALQLGQTVDFTGTLFYELSTADAGTIEMRIGGNQPLQAPGTQPSAEITRSSGRVTLSQTITLPSTGMTIVSVAFDLTPATATNGVVVHQIRVVYYFF